mmetsp:Transcript_73276/g.152930  ORF Transcript_73276/g.152930 Transcript_73276/m.152930 type:complete len:262 (+) Transcript_73276:410-1195(+)
MASSRTCNLEVRDPSLLADAAIVSSKLRAVSIVESVVRGAWTFESGRTSSLARSCSGAIAGVTASEGATGVACANCTRAAAKEPSLAAASSRFAMRSTRGRVTSASSSREPGGSSRAEAATASAPGAIPRKMFSRDPSKDATTKASLISFLRDSNCDAASSGGGAEAAGGSSVASDCGHAVFSGTTSSVASMSSGSEGGTLVSSDSNVAAAWPPPSGGSLFLCCCCWSPAASPARSSVFPTMRSAKAASSTAAKSSSASWP